jgi:uncharacterized protein (TIGR00297 family)
LDDFPSQLNDPATRAIAGFLAAAIIAFAAHRVRALALSGAVAATLVGGMLVAAGGWWLGLILVVYFATSSALSRRARHPTPGTQQARGSRRDAVQVFANGAIPVAFALVSLIPGDPSTWLVASVGAIAGAASDTWATEIGRHSRSKPRLLTTGQQVEPGTSGAITLFGTAAAIVAAALIATTAAIGHSAGWLDVHGSTAALLLVVTIAGVAGCFTDSLLGATLQQRRWCPSCRAVTERPVHQCGTSTIHHSGHTWMNNDVVNLIGILTAGVFAALLAQLA